MKNGKKLSFLVIGLGSVGKRHLRNLAALGIENIWVLRRENKRPNDNDLPPFKIETDLAAALSRRPDAVIIASPTSLHLPQAMVAADAGCHILMEKPIAHTMDGLNDLLHLVKQKGIIFQTAFQFRFHPVLQEIKALLKQGAIGKIVSVQVHWGEYLPLWHPWEDYRQGYSARADLGGGVVLTLCHPFDYLCWLIGEITSVSAMVDKLSDLEIDTEDTAAIIIRFGTGTIGSIYLDYNERPPQHTVTIIGHRGKIYWDNSLSAATIYPGDGQQAYRIEPPAGFERNDLFKAELKHFIECIQNNQQPICTLRDGMAALEMALAIKKSAIEKRELNLAMQYYDNNFGAKI
jgi:predicted dehydrogenase